MYICTKFVLDEGVEYQYGEPYSNINKDRFIFETLEEAVKMNENIGYDIYEVEPTINRGFRIIKKIEESKTKYFYYDDRERHSRGEILEVVDENGIWKTGKTFLKLYTSEDDCISEHDHYETFGPDPRMSTYEVKPIDKLYEDEDGHKLATKIEFLWGV